MPTSLPTPTLALAAALGLAGCSTAPKASTAGGVSNDVARCSTHVVPDPLVDGGVTKAGLSGLLTFALTSTDPSPTAVGTNVWQVGVLGADGKPAPGAAITKVTAYMPDHGHGSQVTPEVAPAGDAFTVSNLYLFMPGLWQITITATAANNVTDSAIFSFCVGS